jgi:hypothetical protein
MKFTTPVLLCAFNRPHLTERVFQALRAVRVPKIYFSVDGPRGEFELESIQKVRDVASAVDWPCDVVTRFSQANLGCARSISEAIAWFFDQEEQGIILEDDTLPTMEFFEWCEYFLERYRGDHSIQGICGTNPGSQSSGSVFRTPSDLSRYFFCWGWATWRRCASKFSIAPKIWDEASFKESVQMQFMGDFEQHFWSLRFKKAYAGDFGTWDYQMMHQSWMANRLWVVPRKNFVTNIGFGPDATHTKDSQIQENAASSTVLSEELIQMATHLPEQDQTREAIRFLNIFNKDWAGVGNILAELELHERVIQLKQRVFELENLMSSPLQLAAYLFKSGAFRNWRL